MCMCMTCVVRPQRDSASCPHVLELAEAKTGAIYHATQTALEPLDRSLDIFLRDFQLDAEAEAEAGLVESLGVSVRVRTRGRKTQGITTSFDN